MKRQEKSLNEEENSIREGFEEFSYERRFDCVDENEDFDEINVLNGKRYEDIEDSGRKKFKALPVSYEEWEPYSNVLKNLAQESGFDGEPKEVEEQRALALRMTTPEGLQEIIDELEAKIAKFEGKPVDPEFVKMSLGEKIDVLLKGISHK